MSTAAIDTKHPQWECHVADWIQCRDTSSGQRAVKARDNGYCYLPPTQGMWIDGGVKGESQFKEMVKYSKGWRAYNAYLSRALYIPFIRDSADMILGMLWNKPPQVTLPKKMEWVLEKVSPKGEGLLQLMRRLNYEQIVMGRAGLLLDLPTGKTTSEPRPYISMYHAEDIINWGSAFRGDQPLETLNLVVLNESGPKRTNIFGWDPRTQYRVLALGDLQKDELTGPYSMGVFRQDSTVAPEFDPSLMRQPNVRERMLPFIPFTFVGSVGNTSDIDDPPLLGLSDISLAIYRMQADYRQALFMNTQDTLFTKGFSISDDSPLRVGAGGHIHSDFPEADAKYVGTSSMGLPELRTAMENDIKLASHKAGELMDASSRARESGTALEMRIGTKTATLNSIALACGEGMERQLKMMAEWLGLDPKEVSIKPNEEFASKEFAASEFAAIVQAKLTGGPLSYESIHKWAVDRGFTKLSWDEMVAQITKEESLLEMLQPLPPPENPEPGAPPA